MEIRSEHIGKKVFCNGKRLINDKVISYRETGYLVQITNESVILEENDKTKTLLLDAPKEFVGNIYTYDFERVYDRYYKINEYSREVKVLKK